MILLLDNFDSFTYNLYDYLCRTGARVEVLRNNEPFEKLTHPKYDAVVLSPGPETPYEANHLLDVVNHYCNKKPVLGICLGHQALGIHFGAELGKGLKPMHGKVSEINCRDDYLFKNVAPTTNVVRYHSLVLHNIPECFSITAFTKEGEVMAMEHKNLPLYGIQFHPEAILTEKGYQILWNWVQFYKLSI